MTTEYLLQVALKPVKSMLFSIYKGLKRLIFKIRACSSVDRAVVSGTMCGGSIPFRRAAWDVCTVPVRCITGVIRIGNCQKSYVAVNGANGNS